VGNPPDAKPCRYIVSRAEQPGGTFRVATREDNPGHPRDRPEANAGVANFLGRFDACLEVPGALTEVSLKPRGMPELSER